VTAWTVDGGRYVLGDRLRAGSSDEVRTGWLASDPSTRVLVTLTAPHAADQLARVQREAPAVDGCAPVLYAGASDAGVPYENALVEALPDGSFADRRVPIPEPALARIGGALAGVVAEAHAQRKQLGVRPEIVILTHDAEPAFAGICAAGPGFIATAPQTSRGLRSYAVPYFAPEDGIAAKPELASDVFSLCATLYFLGSGYHPFGDPAEIRTILLRIAEGKPDRWSGTPWLGGVLSIGLARDPRERMTARELADMLTSSV
jgi:hypothetical protein